MPSKIQIGDEVYIPSSIVSENHHSEYAMIKRRVTEVERRSVILEGVDRKVSKSKCYKNIGILIINVGDMNTESTLLDPLSKSILQLCRMMLPDDCISYYKIRTEHEMRLIISQNHAAFSYVILIGHGRKDGILFTDKNIDHQKMREIFNIEGIDKKIFISLCCKTGYRDFGGKVSSYSFCKSFIAPFHSIHGAAASQFAQTFFSRHFLLGETIKVAFKNARKTVPGSVSFRLWKNGRLTAGQK